ncbi:MAG: PaaI family thioesterase [Nevskia sp.]|nr:PaaI family thioesterase [Nevskia sp.]
MSAPRTPEQLQALIGDVIATPLHQFLGLRVLGVEAGEARLGLFAGAHALTSRGGVHGGMLSTVLDVAAGVAAFSLLPPTQTAATVDFHVQVMRAPAAQREIELLARVVKPGRTFFFCEAQALSEGRLCASARITKAVLSLASGQ